MPLSETQVHTHARQKPDSHWKKNWCCSRCFKKNSMNRRVTFFVAWALCWLSGISSPAERIGSTIQYGSTNWAHAFPSWIIKYRWTEWKKDWRVMWDIREILFIVGCILSVAHRKWPQAKKKILRKRTRVWNLLWQVTVKMNANNEGF